MKRCTRLSPQGDIYRREFLGGITAACSLPTLAKSLPGEPDVVIIGAGIAGIQAARTLLKSGKSVLIVEAANRIGGRAYTENTTFGNPFDHGCSWISAANDNPFLAIARNFGADLLNHSDAGEALFVKGGRANAAQRAANNKAWGAIERALATAGKNGLDVPASSVVPNDLEFSGTVQTWIGAMDHGVDFRNLSVLDYWESAEAAPQYLVRQGLGHVVARYGGGLPVKLNTPATAVYWGGKGVSVDTAEGQISAKACIVTVSTGVLNSGKIRFTPALPSRTKEAISNLPMGLLAKIALQFDGARLGFVPNHWLTYWVPNDMPAEACYFLTWPFDFDYMVGFIGGQFGWDLSRAGERAAIEFGLDEIVNIAGSDARKHFVKGYLTPWARNPNTLGAYAAATPGHYDARETLARPLNDKLYFAGEALGGAYAALCSGAYKSGENAARSLLQTLN